MVSEEIGMAHWQQYPFWARGPARIEGEGVGAEVVLDEDRAETYFMHGTKDLSLEFAYLATDKTRFDFDNLLVFVRRYGLLWHGAEDLGTGNCRESVKDIWVESAMLSVIVRMYADVRSALNTGLTDPLRRTMSEFCAAFDAYPPLDDDEHLMDLASVYLAEALNFKLKDCRAGVASTVLLETHPRGPDKFMLSHNAPDLLTAAHAHFARTIVDRAPVIECPGCGRRFTPQSGKQKYHDKRCANSARWRRWNQKQSS
jgi:hypothetical protein